jgi:alpha-L-fucosidase
VGRWLKVNGEAVYGADRSPIGEEFGDYSTQLMNRSGRPDFLSFANWRCTTRPGKLYFTAFKMGRDDFDLPAFKNDLQKACFLGDPDRTNLPVSVTNGVRVVQTPRFAPNAMASVIVVEYAGDEVER